MRIEVIHTLHGFAAIRQEWDSLWQDLARPSPYQSWSWNNSWVEANTLERRLYVLLAWDDSDGTLVGIAPLQRVPLLAAGFGVLTFIGQETSISPDFLVTPEREREFCEAVLRYVSCKRSVTGMVLNMADPLYGAAPLLEQSFFRRAGDACIEQYSQRPIIELPDTYEVFLQSLSAKMRQEMRTARKKLEEGRILEFRHDGCNEDFANRLSALFTLNDLRWEQSGGRKIYEGLYPLLYDTGMLKVFSLYVEGRPVACLSALLAGDTIFAELAGFDYGVEARHLGKGFYGLVIEWAIQNDYRFFDFSSGSEEYKLRFKPRIYHKYRVVLTSYASGRFLLDKFSAIGKRLRWLREPAIS